MYVQRSVSGDCIEYGGWWLHGVVLFCMGWDLLWVGV